ncbi:MAG: hypothetical protein NXI16_00050 [Alphaproteobacteria bacterium]|nr:hypothetical protein [Alphaproteobacteria bacterium]
MNPARLINVALALAACAAIYFGYEYLLSPPRDTVFWEFRRSWFWDLRYLVVGVFVILVLTLFEWLNGKIQARFGAQ